MSFGVLDGDGQVAQIEGHPFGQISFTGARFAQADVRLLSPILPSKVVCVGKNYADHVAEMNTGDAPEGAAAVPQAVDVGDRPRRRDPHPAGQHQRAPRGRARPSSSAPAAPATSPPSRRRPSIFGYTIGNDVTERDMQKSDGQWTRAKGFDSFCPLGPWIETDLPGIGLDPADLEVTCTVDGEPRQQGRTSQLIFDVPTLISYISRVMTLLPGDVILTGTPAGVGPITPGQRSSVDDRGHRHADQPGHRRRRRLDGRHVR